MNNKQILIISESFDKSTNKVIEWLYYCKNDNVLRKNIDVGFLEFYLNISNKDIDSNISNSIVWNRRGYLPIVPKDLNNSILLNYLKREQLPVLFTLEDVNTLDDLVNEMKTTNEHSRFKTSPSFVY